MRRPISNEIEETDERDNERDEHERDLYYEHCSKYQVRLHCMESYRLIFFLCEEENDTGNKTEYVR